MPDLAPPTVCPACGAAVRAGTRFCRTCGAPVAPAPAPARARSRWPIVVAAVVVAALVAAAGALVLGDSEQGGEVAATERAARDAPDRDDDERSSTGEDADGEATTGQATSAPPTTKASPSTTQPPTTQPPTTQPPQPVPLAVATVSASSTAADSMDSTGARTSFAAQNVLDGNPATAWRTPGSGVGATLTLRFTRAAVVRTVGLLPGYAKVDPADGTDRFYQNRRIVAVRWHFDDGTTVEQSFAPTPVVQRVPVPAVTTTSVVVEILTTTEHGGRDFAPISEIVVEGAP